MQTLPPIDCALCPRLVAFRQQNAQKFPDYFNGAAPSFGPLDARFLVVGLAPGLKGANASGRPFTGDYAGEILYPVLIKAGFAAEQSIGSHLSAEQRRWLQHYQANSPLHRYQPDALEMIDCRITNAVRCVPPENKPVGEETSRCNAFLTAEMAAMPRLKLILSLGQLAHNAVLKALKQKQSAYKFRHGAHHDIPLHAGSHGHPTLTLVNSFHTSRYNINTRRLTEDMFEEVLGTVRTALSAQ